MTLTPPVVRFAPSPTGYIHIGNARTALYNALVAMKDGGSFILRFDDTDLERSRAEYADQIEADIRWLGIEPALIVRQSERFAHYNQVAEDLKKRGLLYPCYETPEELDRKRALQRARGLPPVYDRAALKLTEAERAAYQGEGRKPHWRFLLTNFDGDSFATQSNSVGWDDMCRGAQTVDLAALSDPVLIRADGTYLYTLPSVVDDIDLGVTHVIRGEDHVTNTGVQIDIFRALGAEAPIFGHHNLLTLASGEGLSKRLGSLSVAALNGDGMEPQAVAAVAALIGTSQPLELSPTLEDLARSFSLSQVSRAPAKFDPEDVERLNAKLLHALPFEAVSERLEALGVTGDSRFWHAVRPNLTRLTEAKNWWDIVSGIVEPDVDDAGGDVRNAALEALPETPWDEETWPTWTKAIREATGQKGRALFMPLRRALTGLDHGPEIGPLLPLIGRTKAESRLRGQAA
ncbi:MAG: glutamate--tRNA ligase [Pseudomonadota bacterium]